MSTTAQIVAIIAAVLSLYLAVRSFQGHGLSLDTTARMAIAWAVIIVVGVLLIQQFSR